MNHKKIDPQIKLDELHSTMVALAVYATLKQDEYLTQLVSRAMNIYYEYNYDKKIPEGFLDLPESIKKNTIV